jgi:S-adenosyl-L-methionine hydrolase (adenosine-forming)
VPAESGKVGEHMRNFVNRSSMIVLATDFGLHGPYTGQMRAAIMAHAPDVPIIDLFADLPAGNSRAAAYLLAAYTSHLPTACVLICVVDPGVGSARRALVLQLDGRWYVGPDNGLFEMVIRRCQASAEGHEITWRPAHLSESFHGRDIFAPIAARIALGENPKDNPDFRPVDLESVQRTDWPDDLQEVVYLDHYGNAITGLRADCLSRDAELQIDSCQAPRAMTFSSVSPGEVFCYENSNGLMEIAINQGNAGAKLGIRIGDTVTPVLKG